MEKAFHHAHGIWSNMPSVAFEDTTLSPKRKTFDIYICNSQIMMTKCNNTISNRP